MFQKTINNESILIGKYHVSPASKRQADGRYAASVSIRSGQGSATHVRVLRLLPLFDDAPAALRHATHQGLSWLCAQVGAQPA